MEPISSNLASSVSSRAARTPSRSLEPDRHGQGVSTFFDYYWLPISFPAGFKGPAVKSLHGDAPWPLSDGTRSRSFGSFLGGTGPRSIDPRRSSILGRHFPSPRHNAILPMVSTPPRSRSVPPPNPRPSPPTWNSFDPLLPSLPVMPTTPTKDVHYNPSFSPALDSSSCPLPPNSARRKSAPIPQLEHSPYQGRSLTHARSDSAATGPEPAVLKRARTCESLNTICNGGVIAESRRTTPVAASYGESDLQSQPLLHSIPSPFLAANFGDLTLDGEEDVDTGTTKVGIVSELSVDSLGSHSTGSLRRSVLSSKPATSGSQVSASLDSPSSPPSDADHFPVVSSSDLPNSSLSPYDGTTFENSNSQAPHPFDGLTLLEVNRLLLMRPFIVGQVDRVERYLTSDGRVRPGEGAAVELHMSNLWEATAVGIAVGRELERLGLGAAEEVLPISGSSFSLSK